MSYSIYYDRAFIRMGEKYIPLVNSGSNNCCEINNNGRQICEKNWSVLNWEHRDQFLFTPDELRNLAIMYDEYNQESGMIFKTRNQMFGAGEFERWIINGMKSARTIEEYCSYGNTLYVLDYSAHGLSDWEQHYFHTEEELLAILDQFKGKKEVDIKLGNNREVYRPVNHRNPRKKLRVSELSDYYVLGGESINGAYKGQMIYLVKLTRYGFRYVTEQGSYVVKPFLTEKEAQRYLDKYADRFKSHAAFKPIPVMRATA